MQPSLGFSLQRQYALPAPQVIALLQKAGFSAVSPVWTPDLDLSAIAATTKDLGMTIQSLHAPTRDVAALWRDDPAEPSGIKAAVLRSIDACSQFQIPILVLHCWRGLDYRFREDTLYFENFDQIITYAQDNGVTIAFENLEGEEFLAALMARYHGCSHVGYCWDSGHDHCYPHKLDFLAEFGDRLVMTHLNDNLGTRDPAGAPTTADDLHFLPYDGNLDWEQSIRRLQNARKVDFLNFELKVTAHSKHPQDRIYENMPLTQYLAEAGKRAKQIAALYDQLT